MTTNHNCCDKQNVKKGLWSPEEDEKLVNFINKYGHGCWSTMPRYAGLQRCGKSCRLRWINYLRPDLKRGTFTPQEAALVIECHKLVGNKWSHISHLLPGRTDNEIKNFWNSGLKKKIVAHQKHVQALKKAAAAADFAQNQKLYYVNPNPQINHQMLNMNPIILPAPVTFTQNFDPNMSLPVPVYVPAPVEDQALVPVQASPFPDPPVAWPVPDNNPQILTQSNQNLTLHYQYDDDFISQFDYQNPPFLNDGDFLNPNRDSSPTPAVISFLPELDKTGRKELGVPLSSAAQDQVLGQPLIAENQGMHAYGSHEMKVPPHHIDFIEFGVPLSSTAHEQVVEQQLIIENQEMHVFGILEMMVPAHHIDFIESRMASFVASTPSSTSFPPSSNYQQLEYHFMAPSPSNDAFHMDPGVATASSSWEISEFV
ncbi:uncharacterized protein [Primulina huaijiensis]|uniref:uncharacterized protein n=1 Tax=Primulina huaijiensis TaxID=1492673 RepID=UPI003CC77440